MQESRTQKRDGSYTELKFQRYFGVLVLLLIILFFAVCINIVVTAMKPMCRCMSMGMHPLGMNSLGMNYN